MHLMIFERRNNNVMCKASKDLHWCSHDDDNGAMIDSSAMGSMLAYGLKVYPSEGVSHQWILTHEMGVTFAPNAVLAVDIRHIHHIQSADGMATDIHGPWGIMAVEL